MANAESTTSTTYKPAGGVPSASFTIDPADGYYVAGISVVDGRVVSVSVKSVETLYTHAIDAENEVGLLPETVDVPGGDFAGDPAHFETYT